MAQSPWFSSTVVADLHTCIVLSYCSIVWYLFTYTLCGLQLTWFTWNICGSELQFVNFNTDKYKNLGINLCVLQLCRKL